MDKEKKIAVDLINEFRSKEISDFRLEEINLELKKILPDPDYWNYMVDHVPILSAQEVVERAFKYQPIILLDQSK